MVNFIGNFIVNLKGVFLEVQEILLEISHIYQRKFHRKFYEKTWEDSFHPEILICLLLIFTDLRRQQRVTMTNTEREEMAKKIKDLEDELAMQNVQISELQKQIMDADSQDNENQGKIDSDKEFYEISC